jgi:hypothetical protein
LEYNSQRRTKNQPYIGNLFPEEEKNQLYVENIVPKEAQINHTFSFCFHFLGFSFLWGHNQIMKPPNAKRVTMLNSKGFEPRLSGLVR